MTGLFYAPLSGFHHDGNLTPVPDMPHSDDGPQRRTGIMLQGCVCSLPWYCRMIAASIAIMLVFSCSFAGGEAELTRGVGKNHKTASPHGHQSGAVMNMLQQKFGILEAYRGIMQNDPFTFHCPLPLFKKGALR